MKRALMLGSILAAALPVWSATTPTNPGTSLPLDALKPGAMAGRVRPEPAAGDPRVRYFVVTRGQDPDFAGMGGKLEAAWKNRRLVLIPPEAVEGLAHHPGVLYLQRIEKARTQGVSAAVAELEAAPESGGPLAPGILELGSAWTTGVYSYDGAGNIKTVGPDSAGKTQSYSYDGLGRLVTGTANTANTAQGQHSESYAYDEYGNLTSKQTDGQTGFILTASTESNQLTSSAEYDEAGNVKKYGTVQYFWDNGGMLKEMWFGTSGQNGYVYTPDDERLGVVNNAGGYWTWTVRDFGGKVIREFESPSRVEWSSPWLWVEDYAHGLGRVLVSEREVADGGRRHFHADHLGSTRLVTTDDRVPGVTSGDGYRISEHVYYPFGVEATELRQEHAYGFDRESRLKYTGHERDYTLGGEWAENTNYLDYMHARYYNPNLGRFLSVDPGKDWDPSQPQSWNAYAYVRNNPVNGTDPTGKWLDTVADFGFIGYGIYDMWKTVQSGRAVTWQQNAAVAADLGGVFLPGVTGLGNAIRVANKADAVVDTVKAIDKAEDASGIVKRADTLAPGPFAKESIPAHRGRPTAAEQKQVNALMEKNGCHTCGTPNPGTKSGNAIADHQPPQALAEPKVFLPHCNHCKARQGGQVLQELRKVKPE